MPIKGLTDKPEAAFPVLGYLRKGGKKPERGAGPGRELPYFRFTSDDPEAVKQFRELYGDKPTRLRVMLPYATPEENFQSWQEIWIHGGLVHRCDGETVVYWVDRHGEARTDPRPCEYATGKKKRTKDDPGCEPQGRLTVFLPDMQRLAVVVALTGSVRDIGELWRNLNAAYQMIGDLRGVPFILYRTPREVSVNIDNKRRRVTKWFLHIEPAPDWVEKQIAAMQSKALGVIAPERLALPEPEAEVVENAEAVVIETDDDEEDDGDAVVDAEDIGQPEESEGREDEPVSPPSAKKLASHEALARFDHLGRTYHGRQGWGVMRKHYLEAGGWFGGKNPISEEVLDAAVTALIEDMEADPQFKDRLRKRLHALGKQLYGNNWDDERHRIIRESTKGELSSSKDLNPVQLIAFIDWLQRGLDERNAIGGGS